MVVLNESPPVTFEGGGEGRDIVPSLTNPSKSTPHL